VSDKRTIDCLIINHIIYCPDLSHIPFALQHHFNRDTTARFCLSGSFMNESSAQGANAALVVAAGRGVRAGGGLPKQYRTVGGQPILRRTIENLLNMPFFARVLCVIHPDDAALYAMAIDGLSGAERLLPPVTGGASRQASVKAGVEELARLEFKRIVVHDAVRPFATATLFERVIEALAGAPGAIAALPVNDTLKRGSTGHMITDTIDRAGLFAAQTPQAFRTDALLAAHRLAATAQREDFTDDASLLEWQDQPVALVDGEVDNFKITAPADFARAERLLSAHERQIIRTGLGYDVHAFTDGDHVTIGGIKISHNRGVLAHSDGDVVLHALTDAILGALCDGDIGRHFPPSDERWRNAPSDQFLAFAAARVREKGGLLINLDATLIAEAPRVGPHREAIRRKIAEAAMLPVNAVSIKATTSEQLGFVGRREGLAAMALATISLPASAPNGNDAGDE